MNELERRAIKELSELLYAANQKAQEEFSEHGSPISERQKVIKLNVKEAYTLSLAIVKNDSEKRS